MKKIKNESLQGLEIYFVTPSGPQIYWLKPKEVIQVPESYLGNQTKVLAARKMIKIYG